MWAFIVIVLGLGLLVSLHEIAQALLLIAKALKVSAAAKWDLAATLRNRGSN